LERGLLAACLAAWPLLNAAGFTLPEMSPQTKACVACHKTESSALYSQWGSSKHFRANVGCFECHAADAKEPDAYEHHGEYIATIITPKDCARCHELEAAQFNSSHHAKGGRILGSLDNVLADVVEGNRGFKTPAFPHGNSAAAVNGCWQCHGGEVKLLDNKRPDPSIWPNTGIGRLNTDGSEGACTACHSRHEFSAAQARTPDTCGKCHMGPDHPQIEIYNESKHGIAYRAHLDQMKLGNEKWIVGEDYSAAPTCATCHISATKDQPVTHDVGLRISWNNRPEISIRPEVSDARLGLPGKDVPWPQRRTNMVNVCLSCHNQNFVNSFYQQYDGLIELYHAKFAKPGLALYEAATPLLRPAKFSNKLDFTWYEIWHHEGRRARHGASMMGPDYTHWHGTYEVAKHFYTEFIPELDELAGRNLSSSDPAKKAAAEKLAKLLDETLNSSDHKWYLNKLDPAEKDLREQQRKDFQQRYAK
jgi:hypothetical protein